MVDARTVGELASIKKATPDTPRWFKPFVDADLHVVFEPPKPVLRAHPFQCVDWFNRHNPDCAGSLSEQCADQERDLEPAVRAIRARVTAQAGELAMDPLPALCNEAESPALYAGCPLIFDADHASPYGNLE